MGRPVPDLDRAALDPGLMLGVMRSLAAEVIGAFPPVRSVAVEPLERRLLRYRVEFQVDRPAWPVIGKVYEDRLAGQRGFDGMRSLWDGGFAAQHPASVRIPQPYAYLASLRLMLMEEVPGTSLKSLVKRKVARPAQMRLFAAALAKLHRSTLAPGVPFRVDDHLAVRCAGRHEALSQAIPETAPQIRRIVERARELENRHQGAWATVHGDFHLGQVHVWHERLWILDLDPLHIGDAAYDVAMVFTMLKHLEQKTGDAAYIRLLRDAFIEAYFSNDSFGVAERVPLHVAMIHLKRACKRFRYQDEPGWPDTVRRQIEQGAACIDTLESAAMPRSVSEVAALVDRCPATV
jgi:hypothetical protein